MHQGTSNHSRDLKSMPAYTPFHAGAAGRAHNEAGFRHFLRIELRRASRSGHCLFLVLAGVREGQGRHAALDQVAAAKLFSSLGASVREVDFVGWFKEGQVAGAALVQRAAPSVEVRQQIAGRVTKSLNRENFNKIGNTRVRVVPLRGRC